MKLISAELTNYCQYRYLQVKFASGLTAIIGRNGSGKSNLVKAIYANVTGDFGRNDGVKTDNICQFAEPNAQSKIQVMLEHGDSTLEITRSLRPIATRLKIATPDAQPVVITKSQEATEEITRILGVSLRMIADYVFVDQWSIFDFLSMMPAERAKAFQRLFRTERAEVLWKIIGEHHDSLLIPTPGIDKDVIAKRLSENITLGLQFKQASAALQTRLSSFDVKEHEHVIEAWKRKQTLERELTDLKSKLESLAEETHEEGQRIGELGRNECALSDYVQSERESYQQSRDMLGSWSAYEAIAASRKRLTDHIAALDAQESGKPQPIKPGGYVSAKDDSQWWKDYTALENSVRAAEHFTSLLKEDTTVCPTCGTSSEYWAYSRETGIAEAAKDKAEYEKLAVRVRIGNTYRHDLVSYRHVLTQIRRERTHLSEELEQLAEAPRPDKPREELATFIKQYEAFEQAYKKTHVELSTRNMNHQRKLAIIGQITKDLDHKMCEYDQIHATAEMAAASQEGIIYHQTLLQDKLELDVRLQACSKWLSDDEVMLKKLEDVERQAEAERGWAARCIEYRDVVHRDNLPRIVAQNYLDLMEEEVNVLLRRFDSPFTVHPDETLSFTATFKDGRRIPAGRLSGGEKVILALAFRVAVNDIFARDLGLLILDEPTAGLDEGNLACLKTAISRLRELSSSRGLQVVMITHERDLHNLFDHVIEIGKE